MTLGPRLGGLAIALAATSACVPPPASAGPVETSSADWVASRKDSSSAATEIIAGRYADGLALARHALAIAPENTHALYDEAVALHHLGETDGAVAAYRAAEVRFRSAGDRHGQAISTYGRARALDEVGRCEEAASAYRDYAVLVGRADPMGAERARGAAQRCLPVPEIVADPAMETVGIELVTRHYRAALDASELAGEAARESGWYDYDRAVAFTGLGRTDDAVAAYRAAEGAFGTRDPRGRRLAIYGRARALAAAERCREANIAYGQFAALAAPEDATMAMTVARGCVSR